MNGGQANRIVLNLDDSQVALASLSKQLLEEHIALAGLEQLLEQLIVLKGGRIVLIFLELGWFETRDSFRGD